MFNFKRMFALERKRMENLARQLIYRANGTAASMNSFVRDPAVRSAAISPNITHEQRELLIRFITTLGFPITTSDVTNEELQAAAKWILLRAAHSPWGSRKNGL
jgi:hypothetical protein